MKIRKLLLFIAPLLSSCVPHYERDLEAYPTLRLIWFIIFMSFWIIFNMFFIIKRYKEYKAWCIRYNQEYGAEIPKIKYAALISQVTLTLLIMTIINMLIIASAPLGYQILLAIIFNSIFFLFYYQPFTNSNDSSIFWQTIWECEKEKYQNMKKARSWIIWLNTWILKKEVDNVKKEIENE